MIAGLFVGLFVGTAIGYFAHEVTSSWSLRSAYEAGYDEAQAERDLGGAHD